MKEKDDVLIIKITDKGAVYNCHIFATLLTVLLTIKQQGKATTIDEIKEKKKKREKFVKKTSSSYKELLAIENKKRKAKGLYLFKTPTAGFYKKKGDFENPLFTRPRQPACQIVQ